MSLIQHLADVIEESYTEYEHYRAGNYRMIEQVLEEKDQTSSGVHGTWVYGDNAAFMKYLLQEKQMSGKVNQIYIDPPFFSKANYDAVAEISTGEPAADTTPAATKKIRHRAYEDIWETGMESYLKMIFVRLLAMRDLLAEDGTIWVHLDWHSVHYVKILMDEIFGDDHFINEIIWQYKSGGSSKRHFARKHDTILVYAKSKKYYLALPKEKSYNRGLKPYRFKGVEEFCDEVGWYTMVNMKDVWTIDMVGRTSAERTGYATQKPEALLRRLIEAGSRPGDLVCDFFAGSGTLAVAAAKCGRNWISCDNGSPALVNAVKRFEREGIHADILEETEKDGSPCDVGSQAEISASAEVMPTLIPEKNLFRVTLSAYRLHHIPENMNGTARKDTKAALAKDDFAVVDYWGVDSCYDGKVFRAKHTAYRQKGNLPLSLEWEADVPEKESMRIAVRCADIFGNVTTCEIVKK